MATLVTVVGFMDQVTEKLLIADVVFYQAAVIGFKTHPHSLVKNIR